MKKKCAFFITEQIKRAKIKIYITAVVLSLLQLDTAKAQNLQTRIDIVIPEGTLANALERIRKNNQINFNYNPAQLKDYRVTGRKIEGTVHEVLKALLRSTDLEFTESGNNIAIRKKKAVRSNSPANPTGRPAGNQQQGQRKLEGYVVDGQGLALADVTIKVIGDQELTGKTDETGRFSFLLSVADQHDLKLSFSKMGYTYQQTNQVLPLVEPIRIVLQLKDQTLEEVVVLGYGVAKKKDLTGAVSVLDGDRVRERATTQLSTALQGALPGLTVTRSNSVPGEGATIRVRGITSMRNNGPLVIIDGVPANSINDVNPGDIDQITLLKDAASASIYGARAAAGVVLITTKRGAGDQVKVEYNYGLSIDRPSAMPAYANAVDYMKVVNEREWNGSGAETGVGEHSIYDAELIANYWALNQQNPDQYPNTDWVHTILKDYAARQNHQLSFSQKNTRVSLIYDDVDGLFQSNLSWKRTGARVNNTISFNRWLNATTDVNLRKTDAINPAFSPSNQMRYAAPVYAAVYSDGRLAGGKDGTNPYGAMMFGGTNDQENYLLNGRFALDIKPLDGLTFTGVFAPIFTIGKSKNFTKRVPYYAQWNDEQTTRNLDGTQNMDLTEDRTDSKSLTTQLFANYTKQFGDHHLNGMLGYEDFYHFSESLMASRGQYDLPYYPYLTAGPTDLRDNDGNAVENAYRSYFGRVMYNFKSRYYLQANVRKDGSSRFHKDHRWGVFPSFSAGWMLSEEPFMKRLEGLSSLKFRGSWGNLGDERIGNYAYQSNIQFNSPTLYIGETPTGVQGASAHQYAIKSNTWEKTTTTNIGFDLALLGSRLNVTADYFWKKTSDMLIQVNIPGFLGFTDPYQNVGEMNTKGWELQAGWRDKIGELHYALDVNIHDYRSIVGYIRGTQQDNRNEWTLVREGEEFQTYYGYKNAGLYQKGEELGPVTSSIVNFGDVRYQDISGPEGLPDGIINDYDRVPLGSSLPRFNYGGNLSLGYKGLDFLITVQGVGRQKSVLTTQMVQPVRGDWYNVPEMILGNYWSNYQTDAQNSQAIYPRIMRDANANNYAASDFWLFDGSYLRVKNLMLGYTLPANWTKSARISKFRMFASVQDLFTRSQFPKGWDPEVSATGYPVNKSVTFGVSLIL